MTITKKRLLSFVKIFPQKIDVDDFIYRLYLQQKLELAENDVKAGRLLSQKKVLGEVRKWFQ